VWREDGERDGESVGREGLEGDDLDRPRRGEGERGLGCQCGLSPGGGVVDWQALRTEHLIGCRLENSMLANLWRGCPRFGFRLPSGSG
jgi:hypothetical protein